MASRLSYVQIKSQIAKLQKQADAVLGEEKAAVVERIRDAIVTYGIVPKDLFGQALGKTTKAKARTDAEANSAATYADGNGNTWGGRGPRPRWLRDALAAGKLLQDFSTASTAPQSNSDGAVPPQKSRKVKARRKSAAGTKVAAKFRDDAGNSWSGRGLQPRWLRAAIDAGKSLDDFRI